MYIPLYNEAEQKYLFRFKYRKFAVVTSLLPLVGFSVCVLLSVWKDFEAANFTHCHVYNFLPSVSAAIGTFFPQNMIWKCTIGVHTLPRYILSYLYYRFNKSVIKETFHFILFLAFLLNVTEISCLFGLSFWSSTDNYPVHKTCFVTFVLTSEFHMLLLCFLLRKHRFMKASDIERYSLKLKVYLATINIISIILASYFFVRHNERCEPMVYTFFAACEYIVILTNIAFHLTSCYEIGGREVYVRGDGIAVR